MGDRLFPLRQRCPACGGMGWIVLESDEEEGHEEVQMVCEWCGGNGRITRQVPRHEWLAFQRRHWGRWVFVLLLCVLVTAVLLFTFLREPTLLCGNPWYGMVMLTLLARALF